MKKSINLTILSASFFFVFLFYPLTSHSEPFISDIEGLVINNNEIIVQGNSFGTHQNHSQDQINILPWVWHNFENNLEGDGLLRTNYPSYWTRQTEGGRSGFWAYRTHQGNIQGLYTPTTSFSSGVFFMSVWLYLPSNVDNGKTIRFRFDNGYVDYWFNLRGGHLASDFPNSFVNYNVLSTAPKDTWFRFDMLLTDQPKSQQFWVLGQNNNDPILSQTRESIKPNNSASLGLGAGYDSSTGYYGFDDLFANFTQSRVEICDKPNWTLRSQCEIQIPTTWTENLISLRVNQGSFKNEDSIYFYVIDNNGNVNNIGFELKVGQNEGSEEINPPLPAENLQML